MARRRYLSALAAAIAIIWPLQGQAQPWPAAGPITGSEQIPCTQNGAVVGCSPAQLTQAGTDARAFGAVCDALRADGTLNPTPTDDSAALVAWLSSAGAGARRVLAGQSCAFSTPLILPVPPMASSGPTPAGITIDSQGGQLIWIGASPPPAAGAVQFGQAVATKQCVQYGLRVNLTLRAASPQASGFAMQAAHLCRSSLSLALGAAPGSPNGDANWSGGLHVIGGNTPAIENLGAFQASGDAILLNGDSTANGGFPLTDPYIHGGAIVGSGTGIHIAGNVGGFHADLTDIVQNKRHVLIDTSQSDICNSQIVFMPGAAIDFTTGAPNVGVELADPGCTGGVTSQLYFKANWFGAVQGDCVLVDPTAVNWWVIFTGGSLGFCKGDGVDNFSPSTRINLLGMVIQNIKNPAVAIANPGCTVTASETAILLTVTAALTCPATMTLGIGTPIGGAGFTGLIASSACVITAGAGACTITGGSVAASGPATIFDPNVILNGVAFIGNNVDVGVGQPITVVASTFSNGQSRSIMGQWASRFIQADPNNHPVSSQVDHTANGSANTSVVTQGDVNVGYVTASGLGAGTPTILHVGTNGQTTTSSVVVDNPQVIGPYTSLGAKVPCTAALQGVVAGVLDANSTTFGATYSGSGTASTAGTSQALCNGTNWIMH